MESYAQAALANEVSAPAEIPAVITRICHIAERLDAIVNGVAGFVERCHGPSPTATSGDNLQAIPNGHFGALHEALNRLESNVERLMHLGDALDRIG